MSLASLLVLADGRLPAGGHAHSGGLETAVATGGVRDVGDLDSFLRGRLATAGTVAAAFAAAACSGACKGTLLSVFDEQGTPVNRCAELDVGMDARTPSPVLRRVSRAQGRALLRAGRAMWPLGATDREPHHPVALGWVAAAAGLGPAEAAVAAAYGAVTAAASAAVRLLGLDPYRVHALLAGLAGDCDRVAAAAAAGATDPVDALPAAGAPLLDIGAELHASWEVRLFAS